MRSRCEIGTHAWGACQSRGQSDSCKRTRLGEPGGSSPAGAAMAGCAMGSNSASCINCLLEMAICKGRTVWQTRLRTFPIQEPRPYVGLKFNSPQKLVFTNLLAALLGH